VDVEILTEAGGSRGFGHVARCSGLKEALVEAGQSVRLWIDTPTPLPAAIIAGTVYQPFDWTTDLERLQEQIGSTSVVTAVDSYQASATVLAEIASRSRGCFFFDDTGRLDYPPGTVINAAVNANSLYSRRDTLNRYLLGPQYAVLRKDFWSARAYEVRTWIRRALVVLGTGVASRTAQSIAECILESLPGTTVTVVHEAAHSRRSVCEGEVLRWVWNLEPGEFIDLALGSDLAVCSGGQTLAELACLGVPAISIVTAANQRTNVEGFESMGFTVSIGRLEESSCLHKLESVLARYQSAKERAGRSKVGKRLVDGKGALRIARAIVDTSRTANEERG